MANTKIDGIADKEIDAKCTTLKTIKTINDMPTAATDSNITTVLVSNCLGEIGNWELAQDSQSNESHITEGRRLGLRRQPTKYPHGLDISVQALSDDQKLNVQPSYSGASTLCNYSQNTISSRDSIRRNYKINMINSSDTLAELQVRRYKYPPSANYYLTPPPSSSYSSLMWLMHIKRRFGCNQLRWAFAFLSSILMLLALVSYCIWLHSIGVARERYLQQRFRYIDTTDSNQEISGESIESSTSSMGVPEQHSTILADSINTKLEDLQRLTTLEYDISRESHHRQKNYKTWKTLGTKESPEFHYDDDEHVLELFDGIYTHNSLPSFKPKSQSSSLSTTNAMTKVSPTIPPVTQSRPTSAMTTARITVPENRCYSTSLPMCQGALDYDLTYNSTIEMSSVERDAYNTLIHSNCSARAIEFICALLEPECRPLHIGVLPPCRRICKSILEACSIVIANSDILTSVFDCNFYPDSNNPHKCEDPTRRRDYCFDNEFECYDSSCIPHQWQCDNIKDCDSGEDEDQCLVCDRPDDFRCRSNEKCVSEAVRCDLKYDCFDGSDEDDCDEYGSGEEAIFNEVSLKSYPRVYAHASFLLPNQSNEEIYTYATGATDDDIINPFLISEQIINRTNGVSNEEVTNSVPGDGPKGFVNFRDSKEIMMTSDSETKFKYSATRTNRTTLSTTTKSTTTKHSTRHTAPPPTMVHSSSSLINRLHRVTFTTKTVPITPAPSRCQAHQLRCVSGKCITVEQLCDKIIDCPDGSDELMCVYKENKATARNNISTTVTSSTTTSVTTTAPATAKATATAITQTTRTEKRPLRNTLKRRIT